LRRDPARRWTAAKIAARLKPGYVAEPEAPAVPVASAAPAKAAGAPLSPLDVPLSPERPVPVAQLAAVPPRVAPPRQKPGGPPTRTVVFPSYTIPLLAAVLVIAAFVALPRILRQEKAAPSSASAPSAQPRPETKPAEHARNQAPSAPQSTAKSSPKATVEKVPPASAAPAKLRTEIVPAPAATRLAGDSGARGEVLDRILPQVPDKALNTIHGVVRVAVRVHVDAAGNVSQAELESPGPSRYFADLSLKAANKWVFGSPEVEGKSVASEWLIRFDYSQSGVVASPQQTTP